MMAAVESTNSLPGVAGSSTRQQDFSDLSAISDRKTPPAPDLEDSMSSVAASPRSVGTIEDTSARPEDIGSDVDELLPPPAYTPEDATMRHQYASEQLPYSQGYGTIGAQESPVDDTGAAQSGDETTMLIVRPDGRSYYVQRRRKALRRRCCACCGLIWTMRTMKALLMAISLAALIVLVTHIIIQTSSADEKRPDGDGLPDQTAPTDPLIPWPACPHDLTPRYSRDLTEEYYKLSSFAMEEGYLQKPPPDNHKDLHRVYGKVHLITDHTKSADITAALSIESTEEAVATAIKVSKTGEHLTIDLTDLYNIVPMDSLQSCTVINVVLHVAQRMAYENISSLGLDLTHLSVELADGLYLPVTEDLSLSTVVGSVASSANMRSGTPRTAVHTVSGRISGVWPLNDVLYLETTSGAIDVHYEPVKSPKDSSSPSRYKDIWKANLTLVSTSGGMKASPIDLSPTYSWPRRCYSSNVVSGSGYVRGHYPLGSSATFRSVNGRLDVDILPIAFMPNRASATARTYAHHDEDGFAPQLLTTTASGVTELRVHSANKDDAMKWVLNTTQSRHGSASGPIMLTYSDEWAGTLEAASLTGKQAIEGNGIEVVESRSGWANNYIKAVKPTVNGDTGGSNVKISTISGALTFRLLDN